jgi:hypothetical protein
MLRVFCGSPLNLCGCPYAHKFIVIILANSMMDIVGDATQLFIFTLNRDLDGDMWDDAGSRIAHLSPLILMLAHGYPLEVLCGHG